MTSKYLPLIREQLDNKYPQRKETSILALRNVHFKIFPLKLKLIFEQYDNLLQLTLSHCDLRNLDNFPWLRKLQELDLSNNQLQGTFNNLMPCRNLKYLNIENNIVFDVTKLAPLRKIGKVSVCYRNNPFTLENNYQKAIRSYGIKAIKESKDYLNSKKNKSSKSMSSKLIKEGETQNELQNLWDYSDSSFQQFKQKALNRNSSQIPSQSDDLGVAFERNCNSAYLSSERRNIRNIDLCGMEGIWETRVFPSTFQEERRATFQRKPYSLSNHMSLINHQIQNLEQRYNQIRSDSHLRRRQRSRLTGKGSNQLPYSQSQRANQDAVRTTQQLRQNRRLLRKLKNEKEMIMNHSAARCTLLRRKATANSRELANSQEGRDQEYVDAGIVNFQTSELNSEDNGGLINRFRDNESFREQNTLQEPNPLPMLRVKSDSSSSEEQPNLNINFQNRREISDEEEDQMSMDQDEIELEQEVDNWGGPFGEQHLNLEEDCHLNINQEEMSSSYSSSPSQGPILQPRLEPLIVSSSNANDQSALDNISSQNAQE